MDVVLVGAAGSGTRAVARDLGRRHGWDLVDVDAVLAAHVGAPDTTTGPWTVESGSPRVFIADGALTRTRLRHELYSGRLVAWLDAPPTRLVGRLRAAPPLATLPGPGPLTALGAHGEAMEWYFGAGVRLDATLPTSRLADEVERLLRQAQPSGTLVARADTGVGLLEIGDDIVARGIADALLRLPGERAAILTERRVWADLGDRIASAMRAIDARFDVVIVPPGEHAKTLSSQFRTLRELANLRLARRGAIVAVGDDRICDAATYTAGVYLRGVPLVTVPTTTLGQVDLAIGGKGSVNLDLGRNLVGVFHQPTGIVLDVNLLHDEPSRERRAAFAEVLKYALLGDAELFTLIEAAASDAPSPSPIGEADLPEIVERCALAKLRTVLADERDLAGPRVALNLGHTVSHALEAAMDYRLLHGEAVAYGLRTALAIGVEVGITPPALAERGVTVLDQLQLGCDRVEVDVEAVMTRVAADKKRLRGRTRWVLATGSGVAIRSDIPDSLVGQILGRVLRGQTAD